MKLLEKLSLLNGTSGDESAVREFIKSKIPADVSVKTDNIGNLICEKKGAKTPKNKLMIASHMDEVGFIVNYITDSGYLKFSAVGGINASVVFGRQVQFKNGTIGVIAASPIHLLTDDERSKQPKIDELCIDIGAKNKEEAEKHVKLGDCAYFVSEFFKFGDGFIKGKALDDRAGCAMILKLMEKDLPFDVTFVFTVQEEVGTRGATCAAYNVKPDVAVVLETTTACDISGVTGEKKVCELGKGPVISYMDRVTIYDKGLYELSFDTAKKNDIKCQTKTVIAGGNDSGAIHKAVGGIRTVAVSLPCRYLHSPSCVIKKSDMDEAEELIEKLVSELATV